MRPLLADNKSFPRAKKHKAKSGKFHVNFEATASIDLDKEVSLDQGDMVSS